MCYDVVFKNPQSKSVKVNTLLDVNGQKSYIARM